MVALTPPRRLIADIMWLSRGVPLITFKRVMSLAPLKEARERSQVPPSWTVLLIAGYARLAAGRAELRRIHAPFPWPRLHEAEHSIARIAVEREIAGEPAVMFARIIAPERLTLDELSARMDHFARAPIEEVRSFGRMLRVAALPQWLRRTISLVALNLSPARRSRLLGTFGVSTTGGMGAWAVHLRSPATATLHCGPVEDDGRVEVYLTFDHRVLDGAPVARALEELEEILNGPVADEVLGPGRTNT